MHTTALKMSGIGKVFPGVRALRNVTFTARSGEATALLGANGAGKSTLMNVLGGVIRHDEGSLEVHGNHVEFRNPKEALAAGIAFVHQEMALLPTMSVMDNMFISEYPMRRGGVGIDRSEMRRRCTKVLKRLGCRISPDNFIRNLGTGDRQMVEIGRALLGNNRIFIFDEPTSSLSKSEKINLVKVIERLKAEGMTVIYITHFLSEVYEICDRVCVLRGGEVVGGGPISEVKMDALVRMMVGEVRIEDRGSARSSADREPVFRVDELNRRGVLENISFTLHKGEILGFWGLLGSGRTETARAVMGLDPADSLKISAASGGKLAEASADCVRKHIGFVTEERRVDGLFLPMSVCSNMSMANLRNIRKKRGIAVDVRKETLLCREFIDRLNIKVSNLDQRVETLSGGNQQKVILGRWLEVNPQILILDEPTRGLDVSAKAEIARIIVKLSQEGTSIILISSEIEEMISLCDRFIVFSKGRIAADLEYGVSQDELVGLAAGTAETAKRAAL